jgi:glycosyltransferase involved in cell wall biosynthesis
MNHFNLKEDKISVIPNGVDIEELSKYRYDHNHASRFKIAYAGRLEKRQKNIDKLIRAFKLFVQDYTDSELVIIGRGPYENKMKKLIEKLGLQKKVKMERWLSRDQYLKEIASSDLFIMPSECECYAIAVAEAIVLGIPTIVANSTALSTYVKNGFSQGIDPPITPQKIMIALREALKTPRKKRTYNFFSKIISWDDVVKKMTIVYEEIIEKSMSNK